MKTLFISLIFFGVCNTVFGQNTPAEIVAHKISQKMRDSLNLSESQKVQVFNINIQLNNQKMGVWQQFTVDSLIQKSLQLVENTRDSLYQPLLSPTQFQLYLQKKRNLINNN